MRKSSHRRNGLRGKICLGGSVRMNLGLGSSLLSISHRASSLSNSVDFLVHLGTVMVSVLTSTGNRVLNSSRVPSTDTSNFAETTMGLTRKTGNTPSSYNTLVSLTLCDCNDVNHLILSEDAVDGKLLLKELLSEIDLLTCISTTVDLNLHEVSLLLTKLAFFDLGVGENADHLAVFLHSLQLFLRVSIIVILARMGGEGLFLATVPVLVETTLNRISKKLSPYSGKGTKTTWGFNVTNNSYSYHRRCLEDGNRFYSLLLVEHRSSPVNLTKNVGHTSFVCHESGKMAFLIGGILWERAHATTVTAAALLGKEPKGPVTRSFKLTVRHPDT
mmetsp:Transcript_9882/g.15883  ORF Transcript_9882/g.15883 Transcript_9882/m.15883 type:complete len:331 (-) Transcript_9882:6-998(-)